MINIDSGKQITKLGFAGYLGFGLLGFILSYVFKNNMLTTIGQFISILAFLCLLAAAGGFGIMWLAEHKMIDLITAGAVFIGAILIATQAATLNLLYGGGLGIYRYSMFFFYRIFRIFFYGFDYPYPKNWLASILYYLLACGFYAVLAVRVFRDNRIVALLLFLAFVYSFLYARSLNDVIRFIVYRILYPLGLRSDRFYFITGFILSLGNALIPATCLMERLAED